MTKAQIRRAWLLIQEPRSITLTMALGVYLPGLIAGVVWLLSHGQGPGLRDWVALLLTVGGVVGILGAIPGEWALERVGIIAMVSGWVCHLTVTLIDPRLSDPWDVAAIVALVACLVVRFVRTWGVPRNPHVRSHR